AWSWRLPPSDAELDQIARWHVGDIRRMEPGRRVHPLVEVGLLGVDVAVEVDDPQVALEVRGDAAHRRVPDRVVAAEHDGQRTRLEDMRHGPGDLVEALLDIAGDREDVPDISDRDRLAKIH